MARVLLLLQFLLPTLASIAGTPNLQPQNVTLSTYTVQAGGQVTVNWTMANVGNATCPASATGVRLGKSLTSHPNTDPSFTTSISTPSIAANSSVPGTYTATIPANTAPGTYYIWVVADDTVNSTVGQSPTSDDYAASAALTVTGVGTPNLQPQNVTLSTYTVQAGGQVTVNWTMANVGNATCPASATGVRLGKSPTSHPNTDPSFTTSISTPSIAANSSVPGTYTATIPANTAPGTYYIWVVADDTVNSTVGQSPTSDDYAASAALTVTEVGTPNLQPQNVTLSTYTVQAGGQVTVNWTMANVGNATCPASATGVRLGTSQTSHPNTDPSFTTSISTPSIAANSSVPGTYTATIPANTAPGTYYIWVVADDTVNSTVGQSPTSDDYAASAALTVTGVGTPNLQPQNVTLSTYTVQAGGQVTVNWTMANAGNATCPASATGVRLGTSQTSHPNTDLSFTTSISTPSIAANSSVPGTYTATIPANTTPGTYYIWVVADDTVNSTVGQSPSTDDYAASAALTVTGVGTPNLQPQNVTLSTYSVQAGSQLTVNWTMANVGDAICPASVTGVRLGTSQTSHPNTDPSFTKSIATPAINAHTSVSGTYTATIPANTVPGTYYIWVVADDTVNSTVGQSPSTDDYAASAALTVTSTGTTTLTDVQKQNLMLGMIKNHEGIIPPELVLAIMFQEGGQGAFYVDGSKLNPCFYKQADGPWAQPHNSCTQNNLYDGVMQVSPASRASQLSGPYPNTEAGYDLAISDGCSYLLTQNSRYQTLWETVLHYNTGPGTLYIYKKGEGDRDYLQHVASVLRNLVPALYGLNNAQLADQLDSAQSILNSYLNNSAILAGQTLQYYASYETELDAALHNLGKVSTKVLNISGILNFGNVVAGSSQTLLMNLANEGNSALTVNAIVFPVGFSADWTSGVIPAGSAKNISVTFSPGTATAYGGSIAVNSDATSGVGDISVSGNGVAAQPVTYSVTPSAGANGTIYPSSVQNVNDSGAISFAATPSAGYVVSQWTLNKKVAQISGSVFTITNLGGPASVDVAFTALLPSSPLLTGPTVSNGLFTFSLGGVAGTNYVIQTSTDFRVWTSILTNVMPRNEVRIIEIPVKSDQQNVFYRAIPLMQGPLVLQPGPLDGKDIWTTSFYSYASCSTPGPGGGLNDNRLRVGGFGDLYYSLIQFDLASMPATATSAILYLYCYNVSTGGTPLYLDRVTGAWDWQTTGSGCDHLRLWWADKPGAVQWSSNQLATPVSPGWYAVDLTTLYNAWQNGTYPNFGIQFRPVSSGNNFDEFYSADYVGDPSLRPKLIVTP